MKGKVFLVGAGPGDPDLLTVKALRLLRAAQVVLHDDLVAPEILELIAPAADVRNVAKRSGSKSIRQEEINFLMVALAASGRQVVRLKSGDPLIFGRAGEEMEALRQAKIDYEIVPGVTSALGAAAAAGIPLTHRRVSSTLVLTAGQRAPGNSEVYPWETIAPNRSTLAIYMPGSEYAEISGRLVSAGILPETPCAIVSRATTSQQQICCTTVANLAQASRFAAPALLFVGEVVRFADENLFRETQPVRGFESASEPVLPQTAFAHAKRSSLNKESLA